MLLKADDRARSNMIYGEVANWPPCTRWPSPVWAIPRGQSLAMIQNRGQLARGENNSLQWNGPRTKGEARQAKIEELLDTLPKAR